MDEMSRRDFIAETSASLAIALGFQTVSSEPAPASPVTKPPMKQIKPRKAVRCEPELLVTTYVYDSSGMHIKTVRPSDKGDGTEIVTTYTYGR
jgi:hypothetical protein